MVCLVPRLGQSEKHFKELHGNVEPSTLPPDCEWFIN
uniref:Uncharacterized protein n=1 Tax=Rhizophora mucronata TaxID=61149 RepID=A0A2P2PAY6_RHIMU